MKRKGLYLLALFVVLAFTACGNGNNEGGAQGNGGNQVTEGAGNQAGGGTGAGNQAGTGNQTGTGTQNGAGGQGTTGNGDTNGTQGEGSFGEVSMENLKAAVVEVLGENYWPNTAIEAEMLADIYGITEEMYEEYLAETPMISTNVDTLIIVKAKEGQVEAVETALNAYREKIVNDTMQYPMNLGKIQASRIESFENYVCFVQLGADVMDAMDQGDDVVIAKCEEENEKALDAIRTALSEAQ